MLYAHHPIGATVVPAAARRRRLSAAFPDTVEALLLSSRVSVRWATGFAGSFGCALVTEDGAGDRLATDGRYRLRAAEEAPGLPVLVTRRPLVDLLAEARRQGIGRVGVEAEHLTVAAFDDLRPAAEQAGVTLVPTRHLVESLRVVKDPDELDALRRACAATDAAYAAVLPALRPGRTEREVEGSLVAALREAGADGPAFDAIVAAGPHAAVPHHGPGDRPLSDGDFLTLDFGAQVGGMHADMTRTVVLGRAQAWQREVYQQVHDLQERMRGEVAAGVVPLELETGAADAIRAAGHEPAHGLGHGVGLEIHEEPWLTPGSTSPPLPRGATITIEPGIYLDGRGGVRIEDTMAVTSSGAEVLTHSPRDLLEL